MGTFVAITISTEIHCSLHVRLIPKVKITVSSVIVSRFQMLLVLGDSFAVRLASRCTADDCVQAVGRSGVRLGDENFRTWAIQQALLQQPPRVALIIGGNDVARRDFRQRLFLHLREELCTGLITAGVPSVVVLPIMPRDSMRSTDVSRTGTDAVSQTKSCVKSSVVRSYSVPGFPGLLGFCAEMGSTPLNPGGESW